MEYAQREEKRQELETLKHRVAELEAELAAPPNHWQAREFYATYYATTGFVLGMFAALVSLGFNVLGSWALHGDEQHPLRLIQVYLTVPLAERAFELQDNGVMLTFGCCLYVVTGMILGVPFHLLLARLTRGATFGSRLAVASGLAISMWLVHFYGILSWLQPALFGGSWIVDEIPWWVAGLTHLAYGWTMAVLYPLGEYQPYRPQTEAA